MDENYEYMKHLPCKIGDEIFFIGDCCTFCDDYYDHCKYHCKKDRGKKICNTIIKQFRLQGNRWDSMTNTDAIASSDEKSFYFKDIGEKVFLNYEDAEKALLQKEYTLPCKNRIMCAEGMTCVAHLHEGRTFECRIKTQEDFDKLEYKCDKQYDMEEN